MAEGVGEVDLRQKTKEESIVMMMAGSGFFYHLYGVVKGICELENSVETGYLKNVFCDGNCIAENQALAGLMDEFSDFEEA